MNKFFSILILAGAFFFSGCKDDEESYDPGYAYFPLEVGDYKIFDVQKNSYQPTDTTYENYQIKEVVAETFTINDELRYRLERFKRFNSTDPWPFAPDSVWSVAFSNSKVIKVENNIRLIKLIFPVENGRTWNGNAENVLGEDSYTLQDVAKPFTVPAQSFPNTATVLQSPNDSTTRLSKDYRAEVYAKDLGMIYKIKEVYEYKQSGGFVNSDYKIDVGIKYYEKLSSYGKQ